MPDGSAGAGRCLIQADNPRLLGERHRAILGVMVSRTVAWSIRAFFFALVGVLTFPLQPSGATAQKAQLVGYLVAGLGLLAWALTDLSPAAARYRVRVLPVILGVIAAAAGFASPAGLHENNCPIMLAGMATTGAGAEIDLPAGWLVTLASVVAIEANWIIYRGGSTLVSVFLLFPLVPVSGLLVGRLIRGRRVQAEQSAALLAQTQQLLAEQGRADVLGERARIAREIHDVLASRLVTLTQQISSRNEAPANRAVSAGRRSRTASSCMPVRERRRFWTLYSV